MKVAVFCGASEGNHPVYMEEAEALGRRLAEEGIDVIYGGASIGCMGAVAKGALQAGGHVIGVIPKKLASMEIIHESLTELHVVETMHERKAMMAKLADAFVALPGGAGTLEEWFEVLTWSQIGYHKKPCALLNVRGYYTPLLTLFDHMIEEGFVRQEAKGFIMIEDEIESFIKQIRKA